MFARTMHLLRKQHKWQKAAFAQPFPTKPSEDDLTEDTTVTANVKDKATRVQMLGAIQPITLDSLALGIVAGVTKKRLSEPSESRCANILLCVTDVVWEGVCAAAAPSSSRDRSRGIDVLDR